MESLIIPPTNSTPSVNFDYTTGKFEINGRSTPEHPAEYYAKISSWVDNYVVTPRRSTHVVIFFEYFNTSSSKCILELLKKLCTVRKMGFDLSIEWQYESEDEDMKDAGLDFSELLRIPFNLITRSVE